MDWITLVIFILFFLVLPLLEALQKRRRPPEDLELPPAEEDPRGGWSEEWGEWPFEDVPAEEGERSREPVRPETREPVAAGQVEPPPSARPAPPTEPARELGEEPSLEAFLAPSEEELKRSSRKLREPSRGFPQARAARAARPAEGARSKGPYLSKLRTRDGFREAFVLSEILGPPRGLQPPE
jgi:hypothetical protein